MRKVKRCSHAWPTTGAIRDKRGVSFRAVASEDDSSHQEDAGLHRRGCHDVHRIHLEVPPCGRRAHGLGRGVRGRVAGRGRSRCAGHPRTCCRKERAQRTIAVLPARAGDTATALKLAALVKDDRYKAHVLHAIAVAQTKAGDIAAAQKLAATSGGVSPAGPSGGHPRALIADVHQAVGPLPRHKRPLRTLTRCPAPPTPCRRPR